ncbi:biotin/lipoate A/B ligase family protein [Chlamydia ibidis]|uniref:Biotin/lipoate A/B ligase family protein n=2 Tax=Chlamydia ibidis TaxID=1405396 RepID=S7J378_9CHLA|nr:lipoate--protein ligase family protein [Chlamydia ibidis]EPP34487.1 biotin/lipoate A/B ligase family protein [Chlamydia ibidis]EQM63180.1 biotin/lipoate A/B ligase family protein [Chlamydia ibidis 10-1398/6]
MLINDCFLIDLQGTSIFKQLQIEEALLRNSRDNFCIINNGIPDAIVLGISRKIQDDVNLHNARCDDVSIFRRYTGGGTVFIDADTLVVTWIMNTDFAMHAQDILQWTYPIYARILPETFRIQENDYTLGEKKIGGNAQYVQKGRWVHHTTFLWDINIKKLVRYLPLPKKQPEYRKQRSHYDFLTILRPWFPKQEDFFNALRASASAHIFWKDCPQAMIQQALEKPHRKSTIVL